MTHFLLLQVLNDRIIAKIWPNNEVTIFQYLNNLIPICTSVQQRKNVWQIKKVCVAVVSRMKQPKSGFQNCLSFYSDQNKFLLLCRHKMWKSLWISDLLHFFSFILVCSYVACCLLFVLILVLLLTVASLYLISWTAQRITTLVRSHVKVKSRKHNLFRIHCHICKIPQVKTRQFLDSIL